MAVRVVPSVLLLVAIFCLTSVCAQLKNAQCIKDDMYRWTYNGFQQDPCEVAGILLSICVGYEVHLAPLIVDINTVVQSYTGFQADGDTTCRCSSVYYAIVSACAFCQGGGWGSWDQQVQQCDPSYIHYRFIAVDVPPNTQISPWAYLDYPAIGNFDPTIARANAGIVLSNSTGTFTTIANPPPALTTISGLPPDYTPSLSHSQMKRTTGVIAGSVVGVSLLLIALVIFALWRVRKNKTRYVYRLGTAMEQGIPAARPTPSNPVSSTAIASEHKTDQYNTGESTRPGQAKGYPYSPPLSSLHMPHLHMEQKHEAPVM